MAKLPHIRSTKIALYLLCAFLVLSGWELHVFKLWTSEIYHKAILCDETRCDKINEMANDLKEYSLPTDDIKKLK